MFYILIVGILMAILSAIFWCLEAMPFFKAVKALKPPKQSKNPFIIISDSLSYIIGFIAAIFTLWTLALDIICTVWLTGAFGFSGMVGGVIGVTISNVISVFFIIMQKGGKNG